MTGKEARGWQPLEMRESALMGLQGCPIDADSLSMSFVRPRAGGATVEQALCRSRDRGAGVRPALL